MGFLTAASSSLFRNSDKRPPLPYAELTGICPRCSRPGADSRHHAVRLTLTVDASMTTVHFANILFVINRVVRRGAAAVTC